MTSYDIRKKFFDFFIKNGHTKVESSSLIPAQDPTLLFTNAGMNQFKDVFLGKEKRSYKRAVSIQKCIRAGGKHNDLDAVGFTARHLTFFEMMGNFSFGDYFKKEAIRFAWDFLTKELKLTPEKLYITVFTNDQEAYDIWNKEIGVPESRISKLGAKDNFWQMGDTGPCGPCTEIYVDRGADIGCKTKACAPGCSCDRFMEIWNNVFMQFDRQPNGQDKTLTQTGVDTGMGLERITMIMQDKNSVYDTDLFSFIIKETEKITGKNYETSEAEIQAAFRVLADHIRSSSLAISDGCSPSNEGRGYVLRKIIRRAALFAQKLSDKSFFPELSDSVVKQLGGIYPELEINKNLIKSVLKSETEKFEANLISGQQILKKYFEANKQSKNISGDQAFKLYDTYGFPLELTILIAQENGFNVDSAGFEVEMEKQREQSGKKTEVKEKVEISPEIKTIFTGYQETESTGKVLAIIKYDQLVKAASKDEIVELILDKSPFYVECGGQISDQGEIEIKGKTAQILSLKKINGAIAIEVKLPETVNISDSVKQVVDKEFRTNTMKNHTATHLLQAALVQVLGKTVKQSGSVVTPDYLRFDFTYHENLTQDQITKVENIVNAKITENIATNITETTYKAAIDKGVIAFFGDKYNPESVRVVEVPGFSAELCGGTHVRATGDIGAFKITEVSALSAGNRRLVAVTGPKAIELFQQDFNIIKSLSQEFKVQTEQVLDAVNKQKDLLKTAQAQVKQLKKQLLAKEIPAWLSKIQEVNKLPFLFLKLDSFDKYDISELRDIAQELTNKKSGLYFIVSLVDNKPVFVSAIHKDLKNIFNMKNFAAWLKEHAGINGGGSDVSFQGSASSLDNNLEDKIKKYLQETPK